MSYLNPFLSLSPVAADARKQFDYRQIVINIKTRPDYFWNSVDAKTPFSFPNMLN